eukprot:gene201-biopygen196
MKRLCDLLHRVVQSRAGISWVRACFGDGAEPPEGLLVDPPRGLEDEWHEVGAFLMHGRPELGHLLLKRRLHRTCSEAACPLHWVRYQGCPKCRSGVDTSTSILVPFVAVA